MSRFIEGDLSRPNYKPPFQLGWVQGEYFQHPHVVDANGRIVSFGRPKGQDSLFFDPKKAEKAAELLNTGRNREDISVRDPK